MKVLNNVYGKYFNDFNKLCLGLGLDDKKQIICMRRHNTSDTDSGNV